MPRDCFSYQTLNPLQLVPSTVKGKIPPQLQNSNWQGEGEAGTLTFKANEKLTGLSIRGSPGSSGWLRATVYSEVRKQNLVLDVAFILAPCLWGFQRWSTSTTPLSSGHGPHPQVRVCVAQLLYQAQKRLVCCA